jgi:endonuclease/exonuclease/phosphatase family metal-dependent hydrolase
MAPWVYKGSMRILLPAILCLITSIFPAQPASLDSSTGPGLRVMSFNLRYASDQAPNSWGERLPVCVAQIRLEAPDLIGTQEGLWRQVRDLERALPEYAWIGLGREGGSHGEFGAIFYRRARFELLEFDHFWLSDTPDRIGSATWGNTNKRMVTWARLLDRESETLLVIYNTHFDHQVAEARLKSARLILDHARERFDSIPTLLVGDFNAREDSPPHRHLVGEDAFADSWLTAAERGPAYATFGGYRKPRPDGSRIDWILYRGNWKVHRAWIATHQENGQYPSDHFPVLAQLSLGPGD